MVFILEALAVCSAAAAVIAFVYSGKLRKLLKEALDRELLAAENLRSAKEYYQDRLQQHGYLTKELGDSCKELGSKLEASQQDNERLCLQVQDLQSAKVSLIAKHSRQERLLIDLKTELEKAAKDLNACHTQQHRLVEKAITLEGEKAEIAERAGELITELLDLKEKNAKLQADLSQCNGERQHWVDRFEAANKRVSELHAKRNCIEQAIQLYHDWHVNPSEDSSAVLVKIATILEGCEK